MGAVDAGHGGGVVGAAGVEDAEDVDAVGGVLVGEGHGGAVGEGAAAEGVRVGVAEGAVGEGAGAVGGVGAVGAEEGAGWAEDAAEDAAGEDTGVAAAVGVAGADAVGGLAGVVGVAGACCVDMLPVVHGEGEDIGAGLEAEYVGPEAAGGEDRGWDIAHHRSCQLSASFCFVSVGRRKWLVHEQHFTVYSSTVSSSCAVFHLLHQKNNY